MSLLLDALKKAAQDKQNSANNAKGNTPPATPPTKPPAEELELTLDLEALPNTPAATDNTPHDTLADEPALLIDDEPAPGNRADELPELATDITPPPAEIRHEAAIVPIPPKPPQPPVQPTPTTDAVKPPPAASPKPVPTSSTAAVLAAQQAAAKQRDALEMMINKSRQSNSRNQNLQRYGLIIFCLLLLLLGGIYFYVSSEPAAPVTDILPPLEITEPTPEMTAVVTVEPILAATPEVKPAPAPRAASSNIAPPRRATAAAKPAAAKPVTEPLQFSRTTRPDPIESLLGRAYEKFQAGDYNGANELYTQVLQREADNRDGLLGAAAVAMKQQRPDYARQKYQQLLVLDPKDSLARAGISTIDMDVRDESKLKFMLREQPESPHLYFALGALYASQTRWAEAQQAYFSALSGDNSNADYAYNLAVSLDRLGQYKAASNYYQKALQLADTRRGGFVTRDLQSRIDQIARLPDAPR